MTNNKKRNHSSSFKAKVALEALMQIKTISEIASEYGIHPTQISKWKKYLKENLHVLFSDKNQKKAEVETKKLIEELYKQIGKQKVEVDWLKKKVGLIPP